MIVTPFGMAKELFARFRSQIMLTIIGVTMILVGCFECPDVSVINGIDPVDSPEFKSFVGGFILVVFGLAGIMLTLHPSGTLSAGVMTLGIVVHYVFFVMFLFPDTEDSGDVNYMIRLAFYLLLGFCLVFSLKMIIGSTQNTIRVVIVEVAFLAVFIIAYLLGIHHGQTPSESFAALSDYHGTFYIMLVSVICLNMSDSKYVGPMKRLRLNVEALETTTVTVNDTYMLRGSLKALVDPERALWSDSDEPGVEKELRIPLYNRLRREMIIVRKWEDDEYPIATIMPLDLKVHLYMHLSMPLKFISVPGGSENCVRVRFYGEDGFFVDILVRDVHIRKYRKDLDMATILHRTGTGLAKRGYRRIRR